MGRDALNNRVDRVVGDREARGEFFSKGEQYGQKVSSVAVAQEAYGALKIAEEIIGLLNTAIPRGLPDDTDRKRRSLRSDVAELENPFDNDSFVAQLKKYTEEFSRMTGSNAIAAFQIYDMIDTDMAHRRLPNARAKITDLSLYFMDQTRSYLKRQYPW